MKLPLILVIGSLIALLGMSPAAADEVFADWVISGSTFDVEGHSHTATYSTTGERLYWQTPDGNFLLSITECKLICIRGDCFAGVYT